MTCPRQRLGLITGGSLLEGLTMKLDADVSPEALRAGQYVVVDGERHLFYTMITDVRLLAANPRIPARPPDVGDDLLRRVLAGDSTYVTLELRCLLQLPHDDLTEAAVENAQVKTIPGHFAVAWRASEADVARVFGDAGARERWDVGRPLDMDAPICLNLTRFVERSNGIFGKTGTGKTFLTRLILAGLLQQLEREVVTLVFDMHNEYGNDARQEGSEVLVRGLARLFPERVRVFTLDRDSTEARGGRWDEEIQLAYADIEPTDLYAMRRELDLSEAGCDTINLLHSHFDDAWLRILFDRDPSELADEIHAHEGALQAVRRKLHRLRQLSFLRRERPASAIRALDKLVLLLSQERQHVILEFGQVASLTAYLLVANVLTRKIHERWIDKAEKYHRTGRPEDKPPQLVICVEEAHKFLHPEAARQTSFGQIARELRKYFVSLLIVDQRPSGIDDEILSQLGTRVTAQLSDDKDIQAVLAGTPNSGGLRAVLAGLDSRRQALIFGHAVPLPVVLRTRAYDDAFYASVAAQRAALQEDVNATMSGRQPPQPW